VDDTVLKKKLRDTKKLWKQGLLSDEEFTAMENRAKIEAGVAMYGFGREPLCLTEEKVRARMKEFQSTKREEVEKVRVRPKLGERPVPNSCA
jgi:hypothetical protein